MTLPGIVSSRTELDRRMVAHDLWPRRLLDRRAKVQPVLPAEVFWPTSTQQVSEVVRYAAEQNLSVVPFGAGSGVCGGISSTTWSVVLDLKRLAGNVEIDKKERKVKVDAGMNGERFEHHLNALGFTCGHFPSSIYCSTVGGWVAARGAGQLSSRYGKIEDMLLGFSAVDGLGRIFNVSHDDVNGPALLRLFIGNEGSLCVFTSLTFRVHALATHRWLRGFSFPDLDTGLAAVRAVMSCGESPSVMRLYDPLDTVFAGGVKPLEEDEEDQVREGAISRAGIEDSGPHHDVEDSYLDVLVDQAEEMMVFRKPAAARKLVGRLLKDPRWANRLLDRFAKGSKFIVGLEGDADSLSSRGTQLRKRLIAAGGVDAGDAPGEKWLHHRHRVSYKMARTYAVGGWVDTMEVATRWENVQPLYDEVRRSLRDVAVVMCHFSHAYVDGCSLYFTFAGGGAVGEGSGSAHERYDLAWTRAMDACLRRGANVSHHHGIGRSKAGMLVWELGTKLSIRALKEQLDPHHILNPGVLGTVFDAEEATT
ncbi:MAG: FAD-binding oxidoreductase [Deltaproteobacteria bacterium]|nr:FAD-binding oxidoreductase [Deltaproteobacteria bacterium]